MMKEFKPIMEMPESTVVAEYIASARGATAYQSEADLEKEFIRTLVAQGYEHAPIHTEKELEANVRKQLERLNNYTFTDNEWARFYSEEIADKNGIESKTNKIQSNPIRELKQENGSKNIRFIDKRNIHNNYLQVINQYKQAGGGRSARYDVTILVNGFPLVHIELKRRGVALREAFNQIARYQRNHFSTGSALFEYVQIFVISNGTSTKYYSNTTRAKHIKESQKVQAKNESKTSHSFAFTSFWADAKNNLIKDLTDFTKTFFARHSLLNVLTKYCVFTADKTLLAMRPYQIVATERIINRIQIATNNKTFGKREAGGYIWHTTGSGKTLTSFKTAQLVRDLSNISKVLFVVDRKDLDYQTMKEYDYFEKGSANSNTSTTILTRQLENSDARIIITTIQKLSIFIKKNAKHAILQQPVVLIFDECHRSQFGDMHHAITRAFKKYILFGFTGTPIFTANAKSKVLTTKDMFGDQLHAYTIVDAIRDKNVLPFRVEYFKTMDKEPDIDDKPVIDIDREGAFSAPERISKVTQYILSHFDQKTYRTHNNYSYQYKERTLKGFNAIFCVSSIESAKLYYNEFQKQMQLQPDKRLKIATIFSYSAGEQEGADGELCDENPEDSQNLDTGHYKFLENAIKDYNTLFGTSYDTSSDKFENYYKDVSLRVKNREIDLLIVVNMFLTGFDATTLNTLWVDKNLQMHGLIQAFSRTNRILNSIKKFGNIVCFRNLQKRTEKAVAMFGDREKQSVCLLRTFREYYYEGYNEGGKHYAGYKEMIRQLRTDFPLSKHISSETKEKEFIQLFGEILRRENLLHVFNDFYSEEIAQEKLSERDMQDYQGRYNDLYETRQKNRQDKENINDDIVFEIELIKQIEINIDYILVLVAKYRKTKRTDEELHKSIRRAIDSSLELRSKKELIEQFIYVSENVNDLAKEWHDYLQVEKEKELSEIIKTEKLKDQATRTFMEEVFRSGVLRDTGTDFDKILPAMSRFGEQASKREETKERVFNRLSDFFEKFSE